MSDRTVYYWIAAASGLVISFLFWLLYFREAPATAAVGYESVLRYWNAGFNTAAATCLIAGRLAIASGQRQLHAGLMISALCLSALFLVTYITYHSTYGDTPFPGTGLVRPIYFFVLISHIAATMVTLPMILATVYFAARGRFDRHRRIARPTFPLWLYVSVTGVMLFLFLQANPPPLTGAVAVVVGG